MILTVETDKMIKIMVVHIGIIKRYDNATLKTTLCGKSILLNPNIELENKDLKCNCKNCLIEKVTKEGRKLLKLSNQEY